MLRKGGRSLPAVPLLLPQPHLSPPPKNHSSRPSPQTPPFTCSPHRLCQAGQVDCAVCLGAALRARVGRGVGRCSLGRPCPYMPHAPPNSAPGVMSQMLVVCGCYVVVTEWTILGKENVPRGNVAHKWRLLLQGVAADKHLLYSVTSCRNSAGLKVLVVTSFTKNCR